MFVKKIPIEEALINAYLEEWVLISDTPSEGPNAIEAPMFQKKKITAITSLGRTGQ